MDTVEQNDFDEKESADLLDCYRIALDFGMPAALKAYEKIALEPDDLATDSNANIGN
jgi:hypothetical protein